MLTYMIIYFVKSSSICRKVIINIHSLFLYERTTTFFLMPKLSVGLETDEQLNQLGFKELDTLILINKYNSKNEVLTRYLNGPHYISVIKEGVRILNKQYLPQKRPKSQLKTHK
jgi:hypothetical protein